MVTIGRRGYTIYCMAPLLWYPSQVGAHAFVSTAGFFAVGNDPGGGQQWGALHRFRLYEGRHAPDELERGALALPAAGGGAAAAAGCGCADDAAALLLRGACTCNPALRAPRRGQCAPCDGGWGPWGGCERVACAPAAEYVFVGQGECRGAPPASDLGRFTVDAAHDAPAAAGAGRWAGDGRWSGRSSP